MAYSLHSRSPHLQSLGSQALVELSDCGCFRSLFRLWELVVLGTMAIEFQPVVPGIF
jgi:hypothetical protein